MLTPDGPLPADPFPPLVYPTGYTRLCDPATERSLTHVPLHPRLRCLLVGDDTDTPTRHLTEREPTVRITRLPLSALTDTSLPPGEYGLTYARGLAAYPDPDRALTRLLATTTPGGWLLLDDLDHTSPPTVLTAPDGDRTYPTAVHHTLTVLRARGLHLTWPHTLPSRLLHHHLSDLVATWHTPTTTGGDPDSHHHRALLTTALRHDPGRTDLYQQALQLLTRPDHTATGPTVLTTRARTPLTPAHVHRHAGHASTAGPGHRHRWTHPHAHDSRRHRPATCGIPCR